ALAGVVVLMVYLVRGPKLPEFAPAPAAKYPGWRSKVAAFLKHFGQTIGGISTGPRFVIALSLSVGIWAMQVWTYSLTARSANFNISLVGTVAAILAVNLGFAFRFTPGNVGVFQVIYSLMAAAFGMDREQAVAVALLIQTQQIIPVTLLGVALAPEFIFKRKDVTRADDDHVHLPSRVQAGPAEPG
ncbi:MAG TPA: lysylphosphatidylglycerol synthase transmembrane domain-containing protein, partial [Gemmatimonadaceae bacterium]|nr:lysylphosphatidylglycerol synthase transmembrane domain-containing protein [Gemmatimonadaceae bacterium]